MLVKALIYDEFLELDLFGSLAIFKNLDAKISYLSPNGGKIRGASRATLLSQEASSTSGDVLLIPGRAGARKVIEDERFIGLLRKLCGAHAYVLRVHCRRTFSTRWATKWQNTSTNHATFK